MSRTVRREKPARKRWHNVHKCDWCMSLRRMKIRQDRNRHIEEALDDA